MIHFDHQSRPSRRVILRFMTLLTVVLLASPIAKSFAQPLGASDANKRMCLEKALYDGLNAESKLTISLPLNSNIRIGWDKEDKTHRIYIPARNEKNRGSEWILYGFKVAIDECIASDDKKGGDYIVDLGLFGAKFVRDKGKYSLLLNSNNYSMYYMDKINSFEANVDKKYNELIDLHKITGSKIDELEKSLPRQLVDSLPKPIAPTNKTIVRSPQTQTRSFGWMDWLIITGFVLLGVVAIGGMVYFIIEKLIENKTIYETEMWQRTADRSGGGASSHSTPWYANESEVYSLAHKIAVNLDQLEIGVVDKAAKKSGLGTGDSTRVLHATQEEKERQFNAEINKIVADYNGTAQENTVTAVNKFIDTWHPVALRAEAETVSSKEGAKFAISSLSGGNVKDATLWGIRCRSAEIKDVFVVVGGGELIEHGHNRYSAALGRMDLEQWLRNIFEIKDSNEDFFRVETPTVVILKGDGLYHVFRTGILRMSRRT